LNPDELERIKALLDTREGIILVTGPTGSGKTTTL
jgi:type II secretory ATPase GspE/PulE/Tfp pilus assembly ATPase PilB-like protein